jgi:hypothetical protein
MKLNEEQNQKVAAWIQEGLKLSEIQNKLGSELGLHLTYMEVRFLIDDLKLRPKDKEPAAPPPTIQPSAGALTGASSGAAAMGEPDEPAVDFENEPAAPGGGVSVTVDQIARPGALVSGKVTFSDGIGAEWYLDQMGRLGMVPKQQGYRPSQPDVLAFQAELQTTLQKLGF